MQNSLGSMINLLQINAVNYAAASVSQTGAAALGTTGLVALSWSGSLFLATVENYIPSDFPKIKAIVSATKFGVASQFQYVLWSGLLIGLLA
jgi:hypothetical protein